MQKTYLVTGFAMVLFLATASNIHAQVTIKANITSGCVPLIVQFQGGGSNLKWDLGNGAVSTLANPATVYFDPGVYHVVLTNGGKNHNDTATKTITVFAPPGVAFAAQTSNVNTPPITINFKNLSSPGSGSISSYFWDFGDGESSASKQPIHVYFNPGEFIFTLTVTNSKGCVGFKQGSVTVSKVPVTVTTTAGNGNAGYSGDNGPATDGSMNNPLAVAINCRGDIYVADAANNVIRKIDKKTGVITTTAGDGRAGNKGDRGPATTARLNAPSGIATTCNGTVYIADTKNHVVRKVDTSGIITTIAGNGTAGYSGDGGSAINAQLRSPQGIAVDSLGEVFIVDAGNNCIRKIDTLGIITTIAGTGQQGYSGDSANATAATLNHPGALALDTYGNIYIADTKNNVIRKVDSTGMISTIAGNGIAGYKGDFGNADTAEFNQPGGLAVDAQGNVYIADTYNNKIRKLYVTEGTIINFADIVQSGGGLVESTPAFNHPAGLFTNQNRTVFVADAGNNVIRKLTAADNALPLSMLSFDAQLTNNKVVCTWQTSNEINVRGYVVEKSTNGAGFFALDTLKSNGSHGTGVNTYTYTDVYPYKQAATVWYYRIKALNNYGNPQYSQIRQVRLNAAQTDFTIYPNPLIQNSFTLQASVSQKLPAKFRVTDVSGRVIYTGTISSRQQVVQLPIGLAAGVYTLKVAGGTSVLFVKL